MRASTSSSDSMTGILTSTTRNHDPRHSQYGPSTLLNFFFHRVVRGGPKLLLYPAVLIATMFLMAEFMPTGFSSTLASSTSHLWQFRPGGRRKADAPSIDGNALDAVVGGGLRIVVFGERDIATVPAPNSFNSALDGGINATSWTVELCRELRCSTYLSYIPELEWPQHSLTSNLIYSESLDDVLRASDAKKPADDFSYLTSAYPITWKAPDLSSQVAQFLGSPPPQRPPKETVYVLSFGMWDIWSLASFPSAKAEAVVASIVSDIFANVEVLYNAAHKTDSAAYSNYSIAPLDKTALSGSANRSKSEFWLGASSQESELSWDDASEPFRIVLPLLLDPSLVPGWRLNRPDAPELHTKPEQVRSAVHLTKLWNQHIVAEMDAWARKNVTLFQPGAGPDADKKKASSKESTGHANSTLLRDGIIFRLPDYVMDVIIDGQLQQRGIADKKGFGKFSNSEGFLEVDKPCVTPPPTVITPDASKTAPPEMRFRGKDNKGDGKTKRETDEAAATSVPSRALEVCKFPDQHLFYTPFNLGQRAIDELGRLSAAMVRAKRTSRMAWETVRQTTVERDREPGSWKELYMSIG